jgi:ATP-dependent Clp protease ATP-binding subunit ClpX
VRVVCHALTAEDLYLVLKNSEGSIVRQYEQDFAAYGIEAVFHDDALRRIAELAADEKTGARGLMTVCERVFRELKFELPSSDVRHFEVTRALVDDPHAELQRLLSDPRLKDTGVARQVIAEFAERFQRQHGLELRFSAAATERLAERAREQAIALRELCAVLFKDYQFGLKLIAQNSGTQVFEISAAAVDAPDQVLSEWVVASYQREASAGTA